MSTTNRSELDVHEVLALDVFESPRILLEKLFDGRLDSKVGVDLPDDSLVGEGILQSVALIVLQQGLFLVGYAGRRNDRILHQIQRDLAAQMVRNLELRSAGFEQLSQLH